MLQDHVFELMSAPETFALVPLAIPGRGHLFVLSFPGLRIGFDGYAFIDPEKLSATLKELKEGGVNRLVVLPQKLELPEGACRQLDAAAKGVFIKIVRVPVVDFGVPDRKGNACWRRCVPDLKEVLEQGRSVAFCCLSGIGRSPTFAARMLCELGMEPGRAITTLRSRISDAIETEEQACWVGQIQPARMWPVRTRPDDKATFHR